MTQQEFGQRLHNLYGVVNENFAEAALSKPAADLLTAIKKRIVNEGKNSSEAPIGDYSTKPIYAQKEQFAKPGAFKPQGKNNKFGNTIGDRLIPSVRLRSNSVKSNPARYNRYTLVKPDYTPRKTMYLAEGYRELRSIQGLRTDIMNFQYRGVLMGDYQMGVDGVAILLGFTSAKESLKREGLEKRFGSVFAPTPTEISKYKQQAEANIQRITVGILEAKGLTATIE